MSDEAGIPFKKCACKGIRTCLLCEGSDNHKAQDEEVTNWLFCAQCGNKASRSKDHVMHSTDSAEMLDIQGVMVVRDFVSEEEEINLIENIDKIPWVESQSGRRKHDFGPKVNFKKKKIRLNTFKGFPEYSRFVLQRLATVRELSDFLAVEMCNLDYHPSKGAAIDPHFDDFWLWGERLVTLNLLSETCYTLTQSNSNDQIVIHLPRRSLVVLYGEARFKWMHSIAREHINTRRIGITIRELTPLFLNGGELEATGKELLAIAEQNCDIET